MSLYKKDIGVSSYHGSNDDDSKEGNDNWFKQISPKRRRQIVPFDFMLAQDGSHSKFRSGGTQSFDTSPPNLYVARRHSVVHQRIDSFTPALITINEQKQPPTSRNTSRKAKSHTTDSLNLSSRGLEKATKRSRASKRSKDNQDTVVV